MSCDAEQTNIGNLNRDIKAANSLMAAIRNTISSLRSWITELLEAKKELLAQMETETAAPALPVLLMDYVSKRKAERKDMNFSRYGQQQGTIKDLKTAMSEIAYLKENDILTVEKLESRVTNISDNTTATRKKMKTKESRMKAISNIQAAVEALNHPYNEPTWKETQTINGIMNKQKGWIYFKNARRFPEPYQRQKGWERDNQPEDFVEISDEEAKQMELPKE